MNKITSKQDFTMALCVLVLAFMLLNCGERRNGSYSTPVRIAIGGQSLLVHSPLTLAGELGYYRDEALDVQLQDTAGGSKAMEALLGGSVDVASLFYDHLVHVAAQGQDVCAFLDLLNRPGFALVVSSATTKKIRRLEDLHGAVVGVTSPGSSSHLFLNFLLRKRGLSIDDITINGLGNVGSMVAAMERGRVDAAVLYEPAITYLEERGRVMLVLADTRTPEGTEAVFGTKYYPSTALCARREWLSQNAVTAQKLTRAVRRASDWMRTHPITEIMEKMPTSFRGQNPGAYQEAIGRTVPLLSADGKITPEGAGLARHFVAVALDKPEIEQINIGKTYTNEFLGQ